MSTTPFRSRIETFLDSFKDEKDYDTHLNTFWTTWSKDMPYHSSLPRDDITLLFIGDSKRRGLFQMAGEHSMLGGSLKAWARSALLTLNNIILNDREPFLFRSRFQQMPVTELKKIYLNKHLEKGDQAQQMAAFQLASILYGAYPRAEFMSILHDKTDAFEVYSRFSNVHSKGLGKTGLAAEKVGPTGAGFNIAKEIAVPIVEQTTQPIVQPVIHQEKETIIQPVILQPEVLNVTKETIVNAARVEAPVLKETVAPTRYEVGGIVEQTTQPIVQPVIHREKETLIQPVVVQPEIVHVTRDAIINPAKVEAPILTETIAAAKYETKGFVENITQPVLQPVVHQEKETIIQPVVIQPQIKEVVRETIINAAKIEAPVVTMRTAAPIYVSGKAGQHVNLTDAAHGKVVVMDAPTMVQTTKTTTVVPTATVIETTTVEKVRPVDNLSAQKMSGM